MDWREITKDQFDNAYNQHLPNGWIRFAFKYFSKSTEKENLKLSNWLVGILLGLLVIGFIGTAADLSRAFIGTATITYGIILSVLVLYLFSAIWMNNFRLKKIMKILGVTKQEYNWLADKFYGYI